MLFANMPYLIFPKNLLPGFTFHQPICFCWVTAMTIETHSNALSLLILHIASLFSHFFLALQSFCFIVLEFLKVFFTVFLYCQFLNHFLGSPLQKLENIVFIKTMFMYPLLVKMTVSQSICSFSYLALLTVLFYETYFWFICPLFVYRVDIFLHPLMWI